MLQDLVRFEPSINKVLGQGSTQPGLHVQVNVQQPLGNAAEPLGNYKPGIDTPKFGDNTGPHCYSIPFHGITLNDGASPVTNYGPAGSAAAGTSAAGTGLSLANTPAENELVNEISAPALGVTPKSLPGWSSVLVGPLYRGRQVRLG